jgi:hypothetical protein
MCLAGRQTQNMPRCFFQLQKLRALSASIAVFNASGRVVSLRPVQLIHPAGSTPCAAVNKFTAAFLMHREGALQLRL